VHLYGNPAEMHAIQELAERHGLQVLGDAAQAHGSAIGNRKVGTFGNAECFSFYPTKNMTTAEGGVITTDDADLAERIRSFVNHGRAKSELGTYDHLRIGHNFRMTDVHAAIGLAQLRKLDGWNAKRRANAKRLNEGLKDSGLGLPEERAGTTHVFHQYTVRSADRDALMARLKAAGIGYGVYYPKALHAYPHLTQFKRHPTPEAEKAAREVLSLPVHPGLGEGDIERILKAVHG
jgi:perosamine synthetase